MKLLAAVVALFACSAAIAADAPVPDPERLKEARALLDAMHVERQLETSSKAISEVMAKNFVGRFPNLDSRAAQIFMDETIAATRQYAREPGGFLDVIADFYATEFTSQELHQIRTYYESPAGQHMLDAQPKLLQEALPKVMDRMRTRMPAVCELAKARLIAEKIDGAEKIKCPEVK
jgi:uncharacterized protein